MVSGLFPNLTLYQGCSAIKKKMHFKEYRKMLIHNNTPEAQELWAPKRNLFSLPSTTSTPRATPPARQ